MSLFKGDIRAFLDHTSAPVISSRGAQRTSYSLSEFIKCFLNLKREIFLPSNKFSTWLNLQKLDNFSFSAHREVMSTQDPKYFWIILVWFVHLTVVNWNCVLVASNHWLTTWNKDEDEMRKQNVPWFWYSITLTLLNDPDSRGWTGSWHRCSVWGWRSTGGEVVGWTAGVDWWGR